MRYVNENAPRDDPSSSRGGFNPFNGANPFGGANMFGGPNPFASFNANNAQQGNPFANMFGNDMNMGANLNNLFRNHGRQQRRPPQNPGENFPDMEELD